MRLTYSKNLPKTANPIVLSEDGARRIEFHLRQEQSGTCTLIALSGLSSEIDKQRQQGPYENLQQAIAARNAIIEVLIEEGGYSLLDDIPRWSMAAQKAINEVRGVKAQSKARYDFDPKDVFTDW